MKFEFGLKFDCQKIDFCLLHHLSKYDKRFYNYRLISFQSTKRNKPFSYAQY